MANIIGFGGKYYTLWSYEIVPHYIMDSYGKYHLLKNEHKYYYHKNISKDLIKVKSLYPNTQVDEGLRGTRTFIREEKVELPNNVFWYGKYKGHLIDEIIMSDFNYCLWAANEWNNKYIIEHPIYISHLEAIEAKKQEVLSNAYLLQEGDLVALEFTTNGYNAWYSKNGNIEYFDSVCDENYKSDRCFANAINKGTILKVECVGCKRVNGLYPYIMPMVNGNYTKTKNKIIEVRVTKVKSVQVQNNVIYQHIEIA